MFEMFLVGLVFVWIYYSSFSDQIKASAKIRKKEKSFQEIIDREKLDSDFVLANNICILEIDSAYKEHPMVSDILSIMNSHTRLGHNDYGYYILFSIEDEVVPKLEQYLERSGCPEKYGIDVVCYVPQLLKENKIRFEMGKVYDNSPVRDCSHQVCVVLAKYGSGNVSLSERTERRKPTGYVGGIGFDYDYEAYSINKSHNW